MGRKKQTAATEPVKTGGSHTLAARGLVQWIVTSTEEEKRQIAAAAALAGKPLSHWVRELAVNAAKEMLAK